MNTDKNKVGTDRGEIKKPEYFLHIKACSDSMLWYRDKVGVYLPLLLLRNCIVETVGTATVAGHYWAREDGGPRNIVKLQDAEVVDARYQPYCYGSPVDGWSEDVVPPADKEVREQLRDMLPDMSKEKQLEPLCGLELPTSPVLTTLPIVNALTIKELELHMANPDLNNLHVNKDTLHIYIEHRIKDHTKGVLTRERCRLTRELEDEFDRAAKSVAKHNLNILALIS